MKRHSMVLAVLCVAVLLSACAPVGEGLSATLPGTAPQSAPPEIDAVIAALCAPACAGRAVGSAGNEAAADYIAGLFGALALAPLFDDYFQPYEDFVVYPERAEAKLAILSADGTRTELAAGTDFRFSPPMADITVTLPVSADQTVCKAGAAFFYPETQEDAMKFGKESPRNLAVACASLNGSASLLNRNDERGVFLKIDAPYRALLAAEGAALELSVRACAARGTARNVVSILRGSEGKRAFLVGAHFDGSGTCGEVLFPSAYDNASGTAAMLETARLLAESGATLQNDVIFAAFNGEESGMDGSMALAAELAGRYEQINLINIDCVGRVGAAGLAVFAEDGAAQLQSALLGLLAGAEAKTDYPSDHRSFSSDPTVQAVALADRDCMESGLFHTADDTPDGLDSKAIAAAASAVAALLRADTVYEAPPHQANQPDDGMSDEQRTLLHRLYEDGTLSAFGQMYINAERSPGKYEAVTGCSLVLHSTDEVRRACANLVLPESIGEYAFFTAQLSANMDAEGFWALFPSVQGEYEVGKVYDCSERLRGTAVNARYTAPGGRSLSIFIRENSEAVASLEGMVEGASIDSALAGYWLADHFSDDGGYNGLYYEDAHGVRVAIRPFLAEEALLTALRAPGITTDDANRLERELSDYAVMTKEDAVALVQAYDLPSLTELIELKSK